MKASETEDAVQQLVVVTSFAEVLTLSRTQFVAELPAANVAPAIILFSKVALQKAEELSKPLMLLQLKMLFLTVIVLSAVNILKLPPSFQQFSISISVAV